MSLDTIIQVNITRNTTSPTQTGFGTPMLCGYHTKYADRVRSYTDLEGLVDDGFATTDPIYLMASALLSQTNAPPIFKVGRRALAPTQTFRFVPTITTEGHVYTLTITGPGATSGETFTYTVDGDDTVATIIDGLMADISGNTGEWTATDDNTHLTIAADDAGDLFSVTGLSSGLTFTDLTTDPGIATDLAAIAVIDSDWYALAIDSNSEAEIAAAAAWVETQTKIFVAQTSDTTVLDNAVTTDIASDLEASAYDRTGIFWHADSSDYLTCAMLGKILTEQPGTVTWAYKTLASIAVDSLTSSNLTVLDSKTCNHYTTIAGVNVTRYGRVASGEYFDVMRGTDWLAARIQERVYGVLVNSPKIPYTDQGVQAVRAEILAQLGIGVQRGFLAADPAPTCTVPLVADVADADKAARLLQDVTFRATLAGAIHKMIISGQLSL